jgi:hypothetical protein
MNQLSEILLVVEEPSTTCNNLLSNSIVKQRSWDGKCRDVAAEVGEHHCSVVGHEIPQPAKGTAENDPGVA